MTAHADDVQEARVLARNGIATWVILTLVVGGAVTVFVYDFLSDRERALTTQALATVSAVSRGASAALEREVSCSGPQDCEHGCWVGCECRPCSHPAAINPGAHTLCGTAPPVPSFVPREPYTPNSAPGHDFETGSALSGWRCVKYRQTDPMPFQLGYSGRGPPQSAACEDGSDLFSATSEPWPCPCGHDGFEAWALFHSELNGSLTRIASRGRLDDRCRLRVAPATEVPHPPVW